MPNRVPVLLACGAAVLMASAAHAQPAPASAPPAAVKIAPAPPLLAPQKDVPSDVSPLTVQAAPGPVAAQKESRDFVQSYAASSPIDQIARWHSPICIDVAGLSPDQAARVSARIQEVAVGVGMHILPTGCKANIEVVFTDQPQAFMDQVAKTREEVLGYYHRHDRDQLKTVTRPVQSWYVTATDSGAVDTAGLTFATLTTTVGSSPVGGPAGATTGINPIAAAPHGPEVADDPDNPGPVGCSDAPQFTHCLTSELRNVLIVVDTGHLRKGQTLGPVTDYLSMLALSQVRSLDGCTSLTSVIDLMAPSCPGRPAPDGLTPADAAYLTSLYAADLEKNKPLEVNDIVSRMSAMLSRPGGR